MTDQSLFAEMSAAAEAMRAGNELYVRRGDLQLLWREVQRSRGDRLSREASADLFEVWLAHDLGRLQARIAANTEKLWQTLNDVAEANGPGQPFTCCCGQALHDPADPEMLRIHGPHMAAMGELRRLARG